MKTQQSLTVRIILFALGAIRDGCWSGTHIPLYCSAPASGCAPPSCLPLTLGPIHTRKSHFVQYGHLPGLLIQLLPLQILPLRYKDTENPPMVGSVTVRAGSTGAKRGSWALRCVFMTLWAPLPSQLQLSFHLKQQWPWQAWELRIFLKTFFPGANCQEQLQLSS